MKNNGRGNRKRQQRKRKERMKNLPPKQAEKHQLIDGNFSFYAIAECRCHGGYLTQGLADTHRCVERKCTGYREIENAKKD